MHDQDAFGTALASWPLQKLPPKGEGGPGSTRVRVHVSVPYNIIFLLRAV